MKIINLEVKNFRAISSIKLENLSDVVVVAGPNGCGKSCVFDAIRLLKSAYGGYQPNEWQQWLGEFQINTNRRKGDFITLHQDRTKPLYIRAELSLAPDEINYLTKNIRMLVSDYVWEEVSPRSSGLPAAVSTQAVSLATNLRKNTPEVEKKINEEIPVFLDELKTGRFFAELSVTPDEKITMAPSRVLELIFSLYQPEDIGIIDFHGANRNYSREQVGGINLNIESADQHMSHHALYNNSNKYSNLKSTMASSYVRNLLTKEHAPDITESKDSALSDTLKELFSTFFPGKEFLGPRPTADGKLEFPVRTPSGATHDLNELSSGEKEVLYGYLRLRNAAPKNSVLMIDEPEMHLNPRLIRGLARFYHKHLGQDLGNQLWLVTHSDTLLRDAVGDGAFSVFHMQPSHLATNSNQVSPVLATDDVERVVLDLVGDLASYSPSGKIVIFEGGGDTEFDVRMVCTLFPEFQEHINPISGGSKTRVRDLYSLLEKARTTGHIKAKFFAITDRDWDKESDLATSGTYQWDVFHIENFLLEPRFILKVLNDTTLGRAPLCNESQVEKELVSCAEEALPYLTQHRLKAKANNLLVQSINTNFDPKSGDIVAELFRSIERSAKQIEKIVAADLSEQFLRDYEKEIKHTAFQDIQTGDWKSSFRGRDILKLFVGKFGNGTRYETFRDLIVARMRDADYKPVGMKKIIDEIMNS